MRRDFFSTAKGTTTSGQSAPQTRTGVNSFIEGRQPDPKPRVRSITSVESSAAPTCPGTNNKPMSSFPGNAISANCFSSRPSSSPVSQASSCAHRRPFDAPNLASTGKRVTIYHFHACSEQEPPPTTRSPRYAGHYRTVQLESRASTTYVVSSRTARAASTNTTMGFPGATSARERHLSWLHAALRFWPAAGGSASTTSATF